MTQQIAPEQDYALVTPEDMEAFRTLLAGPETKAAKWKALSRKNEAAFKRADADRHALRRELADAYRKAGEWERWCLEAQAGRRADRREAAARHTTQQAVIEELRQQNADLLNRLAGQEGSR